MPTNFNWSENQIALGPSSIWMGVTVPDPAAPALVIDTEGKPPDGYHLGYTRAGARITIETGQSPFEADQREDEKRRLAWTAGAMVEASLLQSVQDPGFEAAKRLLPAGTQRANHTFAFGGAKAPTPDAYTSMLVVWPLPYGTNLWEYFLIYKGRNTAPQSVFNVTRTDAVSLDIAFRALPLTYRPRDDWYCSFYLQPRTLPLEGE
jgi:hypothetical protein